MPQSQHEMLNEYINKYGAKWLKEINFQYPYTSYNPLVGLEGPFTQLEKVKFRGGTIRSRMNLHDILPAVRSLDVGLMSLLAEDLTQHFHTMESLTIPKDFGVYKSNIPTFEQILELNPQLKHLTIPECQWGILKSLNKIHPNLESLEISRLIFYEYENITEPLRFGKMKKLKCSASHLWGQRDGLVQQIPMEFGNLDEIEFNRKDLTNLWIGIILQNTELRKVIATSVLSRENLERIADGLSKLEEFSMCYDVGDEVLSQDIIHFMQRATQLKKASFFKLHSDYCNETAIQLDTEWENVKNTSNHCSFVRRAFNETFQNVQFSF